MSKEIDEKVVSMKFDNRNFESNVKTSLSTLDKLKQNLKMDGASEGLDKVNQAAQKCNMSPLTKAVETVQARFSSLQVVAMTALSNITNSVINTGKRMLESLTVAPVSQGFSEYELKMGSVQTIMASTGETLETVNGYLNELNAYADKTIYSFSDMTASIGKFTNAGVKLEDAVKAIQGISNEAAVSGANANEASRAMYNFAQALSSGYVKLIDWKSIENANMATVEFKQALLDSAVALGTVVKQGDKYISTTTDAQGKVSEAFTATSMFNDSLSSQWMTTDVLVKTLGEYADENTEIGKKAFAAAQDVKTFTQLMDTLKEAVGSGWATTWEIIFGDFDEAKKLWTNVSQVVGGFIDRMSDARNALLRGWKDMGGRAKLIEALSNAFNGLVSAVKPIAQAFRDIFPKATAKNLYDLTTRFADFTKKLTLSDRASENLRNTFKGLFAILDIVKQAVSAVLKLLGPLVTGTAEIGGGILSVTGKIGQMITKVDDFIRESGIFNKAVNAVVSVLTAVKIAIVNVFKAVSNSPFGDLVRDVRDKLVGYAKDIAKTFDEFGKVNTGGIATLAEKTAKAFDPITTLFRGIGKVFGGLLTLIKKFIPVISALFNTLGKILGSLGTAFSNTIKNLNLDNLLSLVNGGVLVSIGVAIKKFVGSLKTVTDNASGFVKSLKGILDGVRSCLVVWQKDIKSKTLLKIAESIGILSLSLIVLAGVDSAQLTSALGAITGLFVELTAAMKIMNGGKGVAFKGVMSLLSVAAAVLILSSAVKKLASVDVQGAAKGLIGVAGLTAVLIAAMNGLEAVARKYHGKNIHGLVRNLIPFAVSLGILAMSLKAIAKLDWDGLAKGMLGITGLASALILVMAGFEAVAKKYNGGNIHGLVKNLIPFAVSLSILAMSLKSIAKLGWGDLARGLVGIVGLAAVMDAAILALKATASHYQEGSIKGLITFSVALRVMVSSLRTVGKMDWESIAKGLTGITVLIGIMAGALAALSAIGEKFGTGRMAATAGSVAMMAGAILLLIPGLTVLGHMSVETIGKSILYLASTFIVLGGAAVLLEGHIMTIFALSGALALIGIAAVAFGTGISAIAAALTLLGGSIEIFVSGLAASIGLLVKLIVDVLIDVFKAIPDLLAEFAKSLGMAVQSIAECISAIIVSLCIAIKDCVSIIVDVVLTVISDVLVSIANNIGKIVASVLNIVAAILDGLAEGLPNIIGSFVNILDSVIGAIFEALGGFDIGSILKATAMITALIPLMAELAALLAEASVATLYLPVIGLNLKNFIKSANPFLNAIKTVDSKSLEGAKNLADTVLALSVSSVLDGMRRWGKGGTNFVKFGEQLVSFAPYMLDYSNTVKGIDVKAVTASANAAKVLSALANNLPNSGGFIGKIAGENDMDKFGKHLESFGKSMKKFSLSVTGIDTGLIQNAATAGGAMAEMAATIPNSGGLLGFFAGNNDMDDFGKGLVAFGKSMKTFAKSVTGLNTDAVQAAATAGESLSAMAKTLPKSNSILSWFTGNTDMKKFGKALRPFGEGMKEFYGEIKKIKPDVITSAAAAGEALANMANTLPKNSGILNWFTGNADMKKFGKALKSFGKGMKEFSVSIDGVEPKTVKAVAAAASSIAVLEKNLPKTSGIINWFTGNADMKKFGKALKPFGEGMKEFSDQIKGVKSKKVQEAANAGKILAEMAAEMPNYGGLSDIFTGSNDMVGFGIQLKVFGKSLVAFSDSVSGLTSDDITAINTAASAGKALVNMASAIPNYGGISDIFIGSNDLIGFGLQITAFGKALVSFSDSVSGLTSDDITAINTSANVGKALAEMVSSLPKLGGLVSIFSGEQSLALLGSQLGQFGTDLVIFAQKVAPLSDEGVASGVKAATDAAGALGGMAEKLPKSGGLFKMFTGSVSIEKFGAQLGQFGTDLVTFATNVAPLSGEGVTANVGAATEAAVALAEMSANIAERGGLKQLFTGKKSMEIFGSELVSFGSSLAAFATTTAVINAAALDTAIAETEKLVMLGGDMSDVDFVQMGGFSEALTALAHSGITGFTDAFNGATEKIRRSVAGAVDVAIKTLNDKNKKKEVKTAGKNFTKGFADGLAENEAFAKIAARKIADAAAKAVREALDEHSPSKVAYKLGDFFGVAFVNGIGGYADTAYASGRNIADSAKRGLSDTISELSDSIMSDIDSQPTIRPVLDLSNVERGTQRINSIFSRTQAMSINSEIAANTDYTGKSVKDSANSGTNVTFTQNNYSPKALSRYEIYRQTRNQIATVKEALNRP